MRRTAFAATYVLATIAGSLTIADLATPDYAPTYAPDGTASCPTMGTTLYDTENPDQGDSGVVCRSAITANLF